MLVFCLTTLKSKGDPFSRDVVYKLQIAVTYLVFKKISERKSIRIIIMLWDTLCVSRIVILKVRTGYISMTVHWSFMKKFLIYRDKIWNKSE